MEYKPSEAGVPVAPPFAELLGDTVLFESEEIPFEKAMKMKSTVYLLYQQNPHVCK